MKCQRCGASITGDDEREFHGQLICEDCYMVALSPAKACDPWAVYSAKSFSEQDGPAPAVTPIQARILQTLKNTGGLAHQTLAEKVDLAPSDLDREIATLRHMEKLRAEMKNGEKVICLW